MGPFCFASLTHCCVCSFDIFGKAHVVKYCRSSVQNYATQLDSSSRTWGGRMNVLSPRTKPIEEALRHLQLLQGASIPSNKIVSEWTVTVIRKWIYWFRQKWRRIGCRAWMECLSTQSSLFFLICFFFLFNCSWKLGTRVIENMGRRHP